MQNERMSATDIRAFWARGGVLRNAWLTIPDAYLAELVAASGHVETVTIDMQHGLFDRRSAVECIRAISTHRATPFVRLPAQDDALIGFLLDAGVTGLILPSTSGPTAAAALVAATRFPPAGTRSHGPTRTALERTDVTAINAITIAMIETKSGLDSVRAIAANRELDGIFVGPGDLGIALGLGPGQDRREPEMVKALATIHDAANAACKIVGIHASTAEYAVEMGNSGFQFVTVWVDAVNINVTLDQAGKATQMLVSTKIR